LDALGVGGNLAGSRGFASVQNGLGFKVAGDPKGWDVAYRNPARLYMRFLLRQLISVKQ